MMNQIAILKLKIIYSVKSIILDVLNKIYLINLVYLQIIRPILGIYI